MPLIRRGAAGGTPHTRAVSRDQLLRCLVHELSFPQEDKMTHSDRTTVLITGANKGLGFEAARRLGELGWKVFLGSRDKGRGQTAAEKLAAEAWTSYWSRWMSRRTIRWQAPRNSSARTPIGSTY
jgi:hypothetical protein